VRPFYGGIFLDRSLATRAQCFKFDFKMFSVGYAVLPAQGITAIRAQSAALLACPFTLTSRVHSFACLMPGEPVSRGPMTLVR